NIPVRTVTHSGSPVRSLRKTWPTLPTCRPSASMTSQPNRLRISVCIATAVPPNTGFRRPLRRAGGWLNPANTPRPGQSTSDLDVFPEFGVGVSGVAGRGAVARPLAAGDLPDLLQMPLQLRERLLGELLHLRRRALLDLGLRLRDGLLVRIAHGDQELLVEVGARGVAEGGEGSLLLARGVLRQLDAELLGGLDDLLVELVVVLDQQRAELPDGLGGALLLGELTGLDLGQVALVDLLEPVPVLLGGLGRGGGVHRRLRRGGGRGGRGEARGARGGVGAAVAAGEGGGGGDEEHEVRARNGHDRSPGVLWSHVDGESSKRVRRPALTTPRRFTGKRWGGRG